MIFLNLFTTFFKIGALGFGGGLAIVRLIYDSIQQFGIITKEQFANMVAISQATPGPLATNVATFIGHEFAGITGAIVATLSVSLPAFIITGIVCRMLKQFNNSSVVKGALSGIRPAVIGLIGAAVVTLTVPAVANENHLAGLFMKSPVDVISIVMVAATVLLVAKFKRSPIFVLLIMGCAGAILRIWY